MVQQAYEHEAAAESWRLRLGEIAEALMDLETEFTEISKMSDGEYLNSQKIVRDLS
jgi:hypothetical protein